MSKSILVIGIDQSIPCLIKQFMKEGIIPHITSLYQNGVYCEGLSCPPCDTPTNWTTIATGATTAVHGNTSFYTHLPGEPFDLALDIRSRGSLSRYCTAEYIWDVADRNNITPFVLNYPSGWPSNFKNGAMALYTWPLPESLPRTISSPKTLSYSKNRSQKEYLITDTKDSLELTSNFPPLKVILTITSKDIEVPLAINAYLLSIKKNYYDVLALQQILSSEWTIIEKEEWSEWISLKISTKYGDLPCLFRVKLLELKEDGSEIKIHVSSLYNTKGWTVPEKISQEIIRNSFILESVKEVKEQDVDFMITGKIKSHLLFARREAITLAETINYMKKYLNWKLCFFHFHLLDSVNHRTLSRLYEKSPLYNERDAEKAWEFVRTSYKIVDELVGNLIKSCVDQDTIVIFLSDHGAIPSWRVANIPSAFNKSNLIQYEWNSTKNRFIINWQKSVAFPYLEPPHVWVNLRGRDPQGVVEPEDYETVREEIIRTLYQMRDPDTNENIVKLALKKEEAGFLGQDGERVGDVVYFLNPKYTLFDGGLNQLNAAEQSTDLIVKPEAYDCTTNFAAHAYYLPTQKHGDFSISVPFMINGPGIKNGVELKTKINLIDVAPTIAHLLEISPPNTSQGRIIHELIK